MYVWGRGGKTQNERVAGKEGEERRTIEGIAIIGPFDEFLIGWIVDNSGGGDDV